MEERAVREPGHESALEIFPPKMLPIGPRKRRIQKISIARWLFVITAVSLTGCASITNPVANGIPARMLPDELLSEAKDELHQVPLDWLQVQSPEVYKLDTGDIIGVYIEGALGDRDTLPPINFPQVADLPPSIGFPIPIGQEGTVPLPLVNHVHVAGLTVEEAQKAIKDAYIGASTGSEFLQPEQARILVTLVRPRTARVLIIREDAPDLRSNLNDPTFRLFGSSPSLGARQPGTGTVAEIPEVEADVLTALSVSGGLPGPTAENEVLVYRGTDEFAAKDAAEDWSNVAETKFGDAAARIVRIPLRMRVGSEKPFTEDDIRLRSGDIVFVPPRETDVYYTGGLLPAREVPLPRDHDLRVVEAILRVGGSVINGGMIIGTFTGTATFTSGIESSNPSLVTILRRTPNGGQVVIRVDLNRALRDHRENLIIMPGDVVVLQETPAEAVSRYLATIFNFRAITEVFRTGSAVGQADAAIP